MFESAECQGPENSKYFTFENGGAATQAKKICNTCSHMKECRVLGLAEEFGIWGGTSLRDRIAFRKIIRRVLNITAPNAHLFDSYAPVQKRILGRTNLGIPIEKAMQEEGFTSEEITTIFQGC